MFSRHISILYDQNDFYNKFIKDLQRAKSRVIIESPFITRKRTVTILPILSKLCARGIVIAINTKPFEEYELEFRNQVIYMINEIQAMGINVLFTNGHHRKITIIDNDILYG